MIMRFNRSVVAFFSAAALTASFPDVAANSGGAPMATTPGYNYYQQHQQWNGNDQQPQPQQQQQQQQQQQNGEYGYQQAAPEKLETSLPDDSKAPPALPEGWTEYFDAGSGQPYYYNAADGTTTWDRPVVESSDTAFEQKEESMPSSPDGPETPPTEEQETDAKPQEHEKPAMVADEMPPNENRLAESASYEGHGEKQRQLQQPEVLEEIPIDQVPHDAFDGRQQQRQEQPWGISRQNANQHEPWGVKRQELPHDPRWGAPKQDSDTSSPPIQQRGPPGDRQQWPSAADPSQKEKEEGVSKPWAGAGEGAPEGVESRPTWGEEKSAHANPHSVFQQRQQSQEVPQADAQPALWQLPRQQGIDQEQKPPRQPQLQQPQQQQDPQQQQQQQLSHQRSPELQQRRPLTQQHHVQQMPQEQQKHYPHFQQQQPGYGQYGTPPGQSGQYGQYGGPPPGQYGHPGQYGGPPGYGQQHMQQNQLVDQSKAGSGAVKEALGNAWSGILGFRNKTKEVVGQAKDTVVSSAAAAGQSISTKSTGIFEQAKSTLGSVFESNQEKKPPYSLSGHQSGPPGYGRPPPQQGYPPQQYGGYPPGYGPPQARGDPSYPHMPTHAQSQPPMQSQYGGAPQGYPPQMYPPRQQSQPGGPPNPSQPDTQTAQPGHPHQPQQVPPQNQRQNQERDAWQHPGLSGDY